MHKTVMGLNQSAVGRPCSTYGAKSNIAFKNILESTGQDILTTGPTDLTLTKNQL